MELPAVNGVNGHEVKVKVEDKMDEGQLTRLATGVTVDAGNGTTTNVCTNSIGHCNLRQYSALLHSSGT